MCDARLCVSDAVAVKPVDVVITGLNAILMTEEILKVHTHTHTHTHSYTWPYNAHTYMYIYTCYCIHTRTHMYLYTLPLSPPSPSPTVSQSLSTVLHTRQLHLRELNSLRGCPLYQTSSSSHACTCWRVVSMTTVWR